MGSILKLLMGLVMKANPVGEVVTAAEGVIPMLKIAVIAIDLAVLAALGFGVYHYHAAAVQGKIDYAVAVAQNATLVQTIAEDAKRVDAYKADSDARALAAQKVVAAAALEAKKYKDKSQVLLDAKPTSSSVCKSADDLFNKYIGGWGK